MGRFLVLILFAFLVDGVFGDTGEVKSVKEGGHVTLNTDCTKTAEKIVRWYFNNTLIALVNGDAGSSCSYDGVGGRFKGRLEVNYETGSLNITDVTTEHSGPYEVDIITITTKGSGKTSEFKKGPKCDPTKIFSKGNTVGQICKTLSLNVIASDFNKNKNEARIAPQHKEIDTNVRDSGPSTAANAGICVAVAVLLLVV